MIPAGGIQETKLGFKQQLPNYFAMSSRLNKPKLEEFRSERKIPHKSLVSKLSKAFNAPKETNTTKYEPMRSILWRPTSNRDHQSDVQQKKKEISFQKKDHTSAKLIGTTIKQKVKKYEKLPPGFDEEQGFLEDYRNMDLNTLLDEDDEEEYGVWKWLVCVLILVFVLVAYVLRLWSQRASFDSSINN